MSALIGKKIGLTQVFTADGRMVGVTAIEAGPCVVTQVKTKDRDGYEAVQLGFGQAKALSSPMQGHLKGLSLLSHLREFPYSGSPALERGQQLDVSQFQVGERVNVIGISKGKGFAGVVKRHHFSGGPKTHGQSDRHRAPGSIGSTTYPGRVYKGKRMAGHMGDARVTVKNVEVVVADVERQLLLIKGAVPGGKNSLLLISKAG